MFTVGKFLGTRKKNLSNAYYLLKIESSSDKIPHTSACESARMNESCPVLPPRHPTDTSKPCEMRGRAPLPRGPSTHLTHRSRVSLVEESRGEHRWR